MRQPTQRRIFRVLVWLALFCTILSLISCNNRPETVGGGDDSTSLAPGLTTATVAGETPADDPDASHNSTTGTDSSATGVSSADFSDANTSVPTGGNQTKQTASTTVYIPPYSDVSQEDVIIPGHKHTFEKVWSADEYTHFRRATCGHNVVTNRGAHAYNDNGTCTLKVQGNTAATFEKKNYSMQLFTDSTLEKKNKEEYRHDCRNRPYSGQGT